MAKTLNPIDVATDTFEVWVTRANNFVDTLATEILTANSDANGGIVTGNSHVNGIFSSVTLCANTIRGGNVQSEQPITITSNITFTGTFVEIGNSTINTYANSTVIKFTNSTATFTYQSPTAADISDGTESVLFANNTWANLHTVETKLTTTGTAAQLLTSFDITQFHGAEFSVVISDNANNARQLSKVLLIVGAANATHGTSDTTEYGIITSNATAGIIGTFSSNIDTGSCRFYVTPTPANTNVVLKRSLFTI